MTRVAGSGERSGKETCAGTGRAAPVFASLTLCLRKQNNISMMTKTRLVRTPILSFFMEQMLEPYQHGLEKTPQLPNPNFPDAWGRSLASPFGITLTATPSEPDVNSMSTASNHRGTDTTAQAEMVWTCAEWATSTLRTPSTESSSVTNEGAATSTLQTPSTESSSVTNEGAATSALQTPSTESSSVTNEGAVHAVKRNQEHFYDSFDDFATATQFASDRKNTQENIYYLATFPGAQMTDNQQIEYETIYPLKDSTPKEEDEQLYTHVIKPKE
ncbi:hypothetical protein SRHO_G00099410 [Serrasalmus rhombeus]